MSMEMLMCSPDNSTGPPYTRPLLEIEKNFDVCGFFTWHTANWTLCFPFIGVYLIVIFLGKEYMKNRPPFQLRGALVVWNIALAVFSMVCTWRMLPAAFYAVRNYGFLNTVCRLDSMEQRQAVGIWMFLYVLSKIVEFGDTVFIVLRKSPLIFLHWYHHVTVVFSVWSSGGFATPMHVYFCTFNPFAHSVMYSYYALKVLKIRVPKAVSIAITVLQLVQLGSLMYVTVHAYRAKSADPTCFVPGPAIAIAGSINVTYIVLFLNYFVKTYFGKTTLKWTRNEQHKKTA